MIFLLGENYLGEAIEAIGRGEVNLKPLFVVVGGSLRFKLR